MIAKVLGYQGIPTTRTEPNCECSFDCLRQNPGCDGIDGERTVVDPVYVVPQMLPCPECRGFGCLACAEIAGGTNREHGPCPNGCDSGVVAPPKPDYIATWQCRHRLSSSNPEWRVSCPFADFVADAAHERRQVVAYKVTAIDELPVVDANVVDTVEGPCIDVNPSDGTAWLWEAGMEPQVVTDEPWAASLTPGRPVWRLHLEALDQPYTEMVCLCPGYREGVLTGKPGKFVRRPDWCRTCSHDTPGRVPLSVPVGEVTELELAP